MRGRDESHETRSNLDHGEDGDDLGLTLARLFSVHDEVEGTIAHRPADLGESEDRASGRSAHGASEKGRSRTNRSSRASRVEVRDCELLTISENRNEKALRLTSVLPLGRGLSIKWVLDLPPPLITTTSKQQATKE